MKFTSSILSLIVLVASVSCAPVSISKRDVDPALVPELGGQAGLNPTGTGNCDGAVNGADGKPIQVPCACPPDRAIFLQSLNANVAAGKAVNNPTVPVTFPTDSSIASQEARITAMSITLQNLNGVGKGCPIVSTTLQAQAKAIAAGTAAPAPAAPAPAASASATPVLAAPASSAPAPTSTSLAPVSSGSPSVVDPALVPELGGQAGLNPTGTGNCDGAVNGADGKPIQVPCACPPDRATFLQSLNANVAAGKAVNNPTVPVTFPTDSSIASQEARITAMSITLQNLNGVGKGCPIVSTTLQAQAKAIAAGTAPPAAPSTAAALVAPAAPSATPSAAACSA